MSDDDRNDDDPEDDDPHDDDLEDDDPVDDYLNMSDEELERERKKLQRKIDSLDKSILVLNSLSKHTARLQEILAAISDSYDSGSEASAKLIGERRYTEKQILSSIDSLSGLDLEAFASFSPDYEYLATRLEMSEEEEENR